MADLTESTRESVRWYASKGVGGNILLFPIFDDERRIYAVNAVNYPEKRGEDGLRLQAGVVVLARIVGDQVVIEEDATDRPLVDALVQRGIPRSQIVLAYDGEPIPDAALYDID